MTNGDAKLLDLHHINGVTQDNNWANLMALCKLCHAGQPQHGRLQASEEDERRIRELRNRKNGNRGEDDQLGPAVSGRGVGSAP